MRLIDADKLKQHYAWWNNEQQRDFDAIVDLQPTVDAVPVVRCQECRFYDNGGAKIGKCEVWDYWTKTGDYCFFGERGGDETESAQTTGVDG